MKAKLPGNAFTSFVETMFHLNIQILQEVKEDVFIAEGLNPLANGDWMKN
jgi:hypothetical protein